MSDENLLKQIRNQYDIAIKHDEPKRTKLLINLMNQMESNFKVFIINPTKEEMEQPEVKLYREISEARSGEY